jgi:cell division protease FtsH
VSADFGHAMTTAHDMVWRYGMGTNGFIGNYEMLAGSWVFRSGSSGDHLSDHMKEQLNRETHTILQACAQDVEALLKREDVLLERFTAELLEHNELEYDAIEAIFAEYGKQRPLVSKTVPA